MAFTVADYILKRLSEQHVDTLFGVPAAYCAPLMANYFNFRKTTIYGGSNEVQRNIVAQTVLGV